jgi:hypothetical protein
VTENELFQKSERITMQIRSRMASEARRPKSNKIAEFSCVTVGEASHMYAFEYLWECKDTCSDSLALIIQGNVNAKLDIKTAWLKKTVTKMKLKTMPFCVIVDGSVNIDGDVLDERHKYLNLLVTGNISCDYLLSSDGRIEILGDLEAKYGICGQYNDGSLKVGGKLLSPYIVAGDHDMPREADCEWIYIEASDGNDEIYVGSNTGSGSGWDWNYFDDSNALLSPQVWQDGESFDTAAFFKIVRRGENPFAKP